MMNKIERNKKCRGTYYYHATHERVMNEIMMMMRAHDKNILRECERRRSIERPTTKQTRRAKFNTTYYRASRTSKRDACTRICAKNARNDDEDWITKQQTRGNTTQTSERDICARTRICANNTNDDEEDRRTTDDETTNGRPRRRNTATARERAERAAEQAR